MAASDTLLYAIQLDDQGSPKLVKFADKITTVEKTTRKAAQAADEADRKLGKLGDRSSSLSGQIGVLQGRMAEGAASSLGMGQAMSSLAAGPLVATGAAAAAVIGGLSALTMHAVQTADAVNDMSLATGISTETLSSWAHIADKSGTSLDKVVDIMGKVQVKMGEGSESFEQLGIRGATAEETMANLADKLAATADPIERARIGNEALGKSWRDAMPLLREGGDQLREMAENAPIVTAEMAAMADQFGDDWADLKGSFSSLGLSIAGEVMPYVNDLVGGLNDIIGSIREINRQADSAQGRRNELFAQAEDMSERIWSTRISREMEQGRGMKSQTQTTARIFRELQANDPELKRRKAEEDRQAQEAEDKRKSDEAAAKARTTEEERKERADAAARAAESRQSALEQEQAYLQSQALARRQREREVEEARAAREARLAEDEQVSRSLALEKARVLGLSGNLDAMDSWELNLRLRDHEMGQGRIQSADAADEQSYEAWAESAQKARALGYKGDVGHQRAAELDELIQRLEQAKAKAEEFDEAYAGAIGNFSSSMAEGFASIVVDGENAAEVLEKGFENAFRNIVKNAIESGLTSLMTYLLRALAAGGTGGASEGFLSAFKLMFAADGTSYAPGGYAVLAERGPERVRTAQGGDFMAASPGLYALSRGATVYPADHAQSASAGARRATVREIDLSAEQDARLRSGRAVIVEIIDDHLASAPPSLIRGQEMAAWGRSR